MYHPNPDDTDVSVKACQGISSGYFSCDYIFTHVPSPFSTEQVMIGESLVTDNDLKKVCR